MGLLCSVLVSMCSVGLFVFVGGILYMIVFVCWIVVCSVLLIGILLVS